MASVSYNEFLNDVQTKSKEDITRKYESQLSKEPSTETGKVEELILNHLEAKDAFAVWKYIANAEEGELKEMKDLWVYQKVIEKEKREVKKSFYDGLRELCGWQNVKKLWPWQCPYTSNKGNKEAKQAIQSRQRYAPPPIEQHEREEENEQTWLTILSDPLFIGLKWLWNTNQKNSSSIKEDAESKEDRDSQDVIQGALHDAYLLEQLAKHEHRNNRDDYLTRALTCENFAVGVVEQGSSKDLHEVMDIEGTGILVHKDNKSYAACGNRNYSVSLRLLESAVEMGRKRFVSTPKCQCVLDEIVYQDPSWQDRNMAVKLIWALCIQFPLVVILSCVYIPYMLARPCQKTPLCRKHLKMDCSSCCRCLNSSDGCYNWFGCLLRNTFEHPYSKRVNHTTWYLIFLLLVFSCTYVKTFGTTITGLSTLDYVMMSFVSGLVVAEVSEAYRQGLFAFYSKWWNVMDSIILASWFIAYALWLIAWVAQGLDWQPRNQEFIWSDLFFASASVMSFWHLTHVLQFNSTLGPLQLSMYKMLNDVLKFILIFLLLYTSFATGLTKIYTFYEASQMKLRDQNDTYYELVHPYGKHMSTFLGLFWLLIGNIDVDDIAVEDPAFETTQTFGTIYIAFYIVFMVIVALSALVAMMSHSFDSIMQNADMEWRFSKTQLWLELINMYTTSTLPSPLSNIVILYPFYYLVSNCCSGREKKEKTYLLVSPDASEQMASGTAMQAASPSEVCLEMTTKSSTAVEDSSYDKDYKKARMETMRRLVLKYLKGYLKKKDQNRPKRAEQASNDDCLDSSTRRGSSTTHSPPLESPSDQAVSTVLADIQESIKSLDSQMKALRSDLASITASTSSSLINEESG